MEERGILYHFLPEQLTPPEMVWSRIGKELDNMVAAPFLAISNMQLTPPPSAWMHIENELDGEKNNLPFYKIASLEMQPPLDAWQNIEKELTPTVRKITPVFTTKKRRTLALPVLKAILVAACVVSVIFIGINFWNKKPNENTVAENKITEPAIVAPQKETTPTTENNTTVPQNNVAAVDIKVKPVTAKNTAVASEKNLLRNNIETAKNTTEAERNVIIKKGSIIAPAIDNNLDMATINKKLKDLNGDTPDRMDDHITNGGGDYISVVGPNGNTFQVSRKLSQMFDHVNDGNNPDQPEEFLDKVIRESGFWKQKYLAWKSKVENVDSSSAPLNFIDPFELINFLKKNN